MAGNDETPPPDEETGPRRVKDAIKRGKRVADLQVIEGGKASADRPKRSRSSGKPKTKSEGEPPDESDEGAPIDVDDLPPPEGLDPETIEKIGECLPLDQNDRDNARRIVIWFGLDLAYVPGMGWLVFTGTHWLRDEGELAVRLKAQHLVDKIKLEAAALTGTPAQLRLLAAADTAGTKPLAAQTDADRALLGRAQKVREIIAKQKSARHKFAVGSGNAGKTDAMLRQAQSLRAVGPEQLDANRMQFNCRNVTLTFGRELDPDCPDPDAVRWRGTIAARPHERPDLITMVADVDYEPEATCPYFLAALEKVQPDATMRRFLQVVHAYALLLGGNDEQILVYHYGTGANGKSAFLEALGRMAGNYRAVVAPETIAGDGKTDGNKASGDIARLVGRRLLTIEELPRGTPLRENLIKALTGGTRMVARFNFKELFEFEPLFTPVLSGNDMPEVSPDYGIFRRLRIVKWGVTLAEADRIAPSELTARFDAERAGILNWLIEGLMLYLANGLAPYMPREVTEFTEEYREERDPVGTFAKIGFVPDPGNKTLAGEVYKTYSAWSDRNGYRPMSLSAFGRRLTALGYRKERGKNVYYLDVKLSEDVDRFDATGLVPPKGTAGDPGWSPP